MVKAEAPNLALNDLSPDPERRDKMRGCRSEGRASSFDDQDDEDGREQTVWEKVGEESKLDGRAGGRAKARSWACGPCELMVAVRASSGQSSQAAMLAEAVPRLPLTKHDGNPNRNHSERRDTVWMARI